jgi:uncharacterized membrane protein YbhN (UPF0104 family)
MKQTGHPAHDDVIRRIDYASHPGDDVLIDAAVQPMPIALVLPKPHDLPVPPDLVVDDLRQRLTAFFGSKRTQKWIRTWFWLVAGAIAVILLLPRVGELYAAQEALRSVRLEWLAAGLLIVPSTYVWAALALKGAVNHPLTLGRTVLAQLAGSFMNKVAPKGLGGVGVNQRYLEQTGVERPVAVAGIALNMAAGMVVHVLSLLAVSALLGRRGVQWSHYIQYWPTAAGIVTAAILLAFALYLWSPATWRKLTAPVVTGAKSLVTVLRSPRRALVLFIGVAGVTAANIVLLTITLNAVRVPTALVKVAAVYLGGEALASANPTPGNLGAIEAALVVGLTTQGIHAGPAVAAVLTYRLLAFWLPILPGFLALRYLQQQEIL